MINQMELNLEDNLRDEALRSFMESLSRIRTILKETDDHYVKAIQNIRRIEEHRSSLAKRHDSIIQLIEKLGGGNIPEKISESSNRDLQLQKAYEVAERHLSVRNDTTTDSEVSRPKANLRAWIVDRIGESDQYLSTKDVIELVNRNFGDSTPESTVTSALTVLRKIGRLKRVHFNDGTSLYGLPEWPTPEDNTPRQASLIN
jgi:hypothetical protein